MNWNRPYMRMKGRTRNQVPHIDKKKKSHMYILIYDIKCKYGFCNLARYVVVYGSMHIYILICLCCHCFSFQLREFHS